MRQIDLFISTHLHHAYFLSLSLPLSPGSFSSLSTFSSPTPIFHPMLPRCHQTTTNNNKSNADALIMSAPLLFSFFFRGIVFLSFFNFRTTWWCGVSTARGVCASVSVRVWIVALSLDFAAFQCRSFQLHPPRALLHFLAALLCSLWLFILCPCAYFDFVVLPLTMINSRVIQSHMHVPCDLCTHRHAAPAHQKQPMETPARNGSRRGSRIPPPPVTIAAMQGRLEHVRHWIEHTGCDVNTVDLMGTMPLHRAALEGHLDVVDYLIARGADLHVRVLDVKDTALHLAATKGHARVVSCLLDAGAHIEARNADNYTPLLAAIRANHLNVVQVLVSKGASTSAPCAIDRRDVGTCLHLAAQYGYLPLTKFLVSVVAMDVNQKTRCRKVTPLHFAARHGHIDMVQFLVERQHANVHARDAHGMTPLHYAADYDYHLTLPLSRHEQIERSHMKIVVFLLTSGSKVKPRRKRDHATPLRCAAMRGHFRIAKTLLDYGARSNKTTTWLFALVWGRDPFTVKYLVSSSTGVATKADAYTSHTSDCCAESSELRRCACKDNHRDSLVSSCGTQPESPTGMTMVLASTPDGCTPLHTACQDSNLSLLHELLGLVESGGEELEGRLLPEGLTPLHLASQKGWQSGVTSLLKFGADVHAVTASNGSTPLHLAAERGHIRVIGTLLSSGAKPNACDRAGATPLLVALRNGQSHAMKYLLRHGADLSASGNSSNMGTLAEICFHDQNEDELVRTFHPKRTTALHLAAFYGFLETVKQLVWDGEDVDASDQDGATPVWIAALMGHLDVVEFLAEQGANLNAVTTNGASVALGAAEFGHLEVLEFLTAPTPDFSFERLSLTRLSIQDHSSGRMSLTSLSG